jgi:hypothetical protein
MSFVVLILGGPWRDALWTSEVAKVRRMGARKGARLARAKAVRATDMSAEWRESCDRSGRGYRADEVNLSRRCESPELQAPVLARTRLAKAAYQTNTINHSFIHTMYPVSPFQELGNAFH